MMKDLNEEIEKLRLSKEKERMNKMAQGLESVLEENNCTLEEMSILFDGILRFHKIKASKEYKIKWDKPNLKS